MATRHRRRPASTLPWHGTSDGSRGLLTNPPRALGWVLVALLLAACGAPQARLARSHPPAVRLTPTPAPEPLMLTSSTTPWHLPAPLQRAVVLALSGRLQVIGGLTGSGSTTSQVTLINPATGAISTSSSLPRPVHDAAGAIISGQPVVFGGGVSNSVSTVQGPGAGIIGALPAARSDLAAAQVGATAYLVGGYDGSAMSPQILATTDGRSFRAVASLPQGVRYPAVAAVGSLIYVIGGQMNNGNSSSTILSVDPVSGQVVTLGQMPQPVSHASALVLGGQLFVLGGTDGRQTSDQIWRIDLKTGAATSAGVLSYSVSDAAAVVLGGIGYLVGGSGSDGSTLASVIRLTATLAQPPAAGGHLAAGSDPSVLPGPVLIADSDNNRLLEVSPSGHLLWQFPEPGDLAPGQTFLTPDDAFFSPDGKDIIVTEEDDYVVSVIDVATHKIVWRYGLPGVAGSGPNRLSNPDDAMALPNGNLVVADIKNCRIIVISKGGSSIDHSFGTLGSCRHNPPYQFGSPNGVFPLQDGNWLVTEINGDWASEMAPGGRVLWSAYPSDTNQVGPDRYLTADYSYPGQVVEFDQAGHTLWRYRPSGSAALDHPSLALPLPNGDVLLNDDHNARVIVVDPRTNQVVWQYGVTHRAGSASGLLDDPDGVDLAPPFSLMWTHASTLQTP